VGSIGAAIPAPRLGPWKTGSDIAVSVVSGRETGSGCP
jgi:hypothetical protein